MVRKMGESDVNTQWTLNYNLSSRLRMQVWVRVVGQSRFPGVYLGMQSGQAGSFVVAANARQAAARLLLALIGGPTGTPAALCAVPPQ